MKVILHFYRFNQLLSYDRLGSHNGGNYRRYSALENIAEARADPP